MRELSKEEFEKIKRIFEKMKKIHEAFHDYPCFTLYDIYVFLKKNPEIEYEGTMVKMKYDNKVLMFGNTSFNHFRDCLNIALDDP